MGCSFSRVVPEAEVIPAPVQQDSDVVQALLQQMALQQQQNALLLELQQQQNAVLMEEQRKHRELENRLIHLLEERPVRPIGGVSSQHPEVFCFQVCLV